jgi:methyl-accepting chemotaxis protein
MTLKQKILLLGAIPVLLMALVVNLSNYLVARSDLESDLVVAREKAIKERKALLSSYLMLAKTAIEGSYGKPDSPEVRQQVKEILRRCAMAVTATSSSTTSGQYRAAADPPRDGGQEPLAGQGYQGHLPHSGDRQGGA